MHGELEAITVNLYSYILASHTIIKLAKNNSQYKLALYQKSVMDVTEDRQTSKRNTVIEE